MYDKLTWRSKNLRGCKI